MASDYLILRAEPPALRLSPPPPAPISENSYTAGGAAERAARGEANQGDAGRGNAKRGEARFGQARRVDASRDDAM